jgi:hypothetical protein
MRRKLQRRQRPAQNFSDSIRPRSSGRKLRRVKHVPPPHITKAQVEAFVASAWAWLCRLLAVLFSPSAQHRRRRLLRLVQLGERRVEHVLFNMAAQRLIARKGPPRRRISLVIARPGFRLAKGDNRLLLKSARIRLRSRDLVARLARLLEALLDPEPFIARYTKRLARGLRFVRLIAGAPAAIAFADAAPGAPAFADSS